MKFLAPLLLAIFVISVNAQRTNESIRQEIAELGAAKTITVEHDARSNVTTIRAVSDNFDEEETKKAGIRAMNFAAGVMYIGTEFKTSPEPVKMSLWAMTSKPVFAGTTVMQVYAGNGLFEIGDVRQVRRERDQMEYVNFQLTREQLKTLALQTNARVVVGRHIFTLTRSQLKLLADLYMATEATPQQ